MSLSTQRVFVLPLVFVLAALSWPALALEGAADAQERPADQADAAVQAEQAEEGAWVSDLSDTVPDDIDATFVPEPRSAAVLVVAIIGLAARRRRA